MNKGRERPFAAIVSLLVSNSPERVRPVGDDLESKVYPVRAPHISLFYLPTHTPHFTFKVQAFRKISVILERRRTKASSPKPVSSPTPVEGSGTPLDATVYCSE